MANISSRNAREVQAESQSRRFEHRKSSAVSAISIQRGFVSPARSCFLIAFAPYFRALEHPVISQTGVVCVLVLMVLNLNRGDPFIE